MEEKESRVLTIVLLSILTILIISFGFFFFAVAKVDAKSLTDCSVRFTYGSDIVSNSNNTTNFGTGTYLGNTVTGHYANLNNIQTEVTCNNANLQANVRYHYQFLVQIHIRGLINTTGNNVGDMKDWTWQTQIRDSANNVIPYSNYVREFKQIIDETGHQAMYLVIDTLLVPTQNYTNLRQVFKTTFSYTNYNFLEIGNYTMDVSVYSDENDGIIDAIRNQTAEMNINARIETDRVVDEISDTRGAVIEAINNFKNVITNSTVPPLPEPDKNPIINQGLAEARAKQNNMTQQDMEDILQNNGVGMLDNAMKQDASDFINDSWELITDNYKIFTMIVILLTLGFMKMILDR